MPDDPRVFAYELDTEGKTTARVQLLRLVSADKKGQVKVKELNQACKSISSAEVTAVLKTMCRLVKNGVYQLKNC